MSKTQPVAPDLQLRFRQIHLDYHTSPDIPAVAKDFDADRFARRLAEAHVDSCTVFARCHHGHLYYESPVNPERQHPTLTRPNLVLEQIEALHARGIRAPVYTTIQWDQFTADAHPEWMIINADGGLRRYEPLGAGFYGCLDVFHPGYRTFLEAHVRDLFDRMPIDGLFFDICQPYYSVAKFWIDAMDAAGEDVEDESARIRFGIRVMHDWQREMAALCRDMASQTPGCDPDTLTTFFNSGHCGPRHRDQLDTFTHFELESLPAGWGYMHFPVSQRYMRTLPRDTMAMTGKFHTGWGDFQSYKNPAALRFECMHALTLGAKCSVGDQLHPWGELEPATYDLIGGVYAEVEAKEPWCERAVHHAEIALLTSEEINPLESTFDAQCDRPTESAIAMTRLMQELQHQFDVVDSATGLSRYRLLIIPGDYPLTPALVEKVEAFVAGGGSLIAMHRGGLTPEGAVATPMLGIADAAPAPWEPDHVHPGVLGVSGGRMPLADTPHVMYQRGTAATPLPGAEVLATVHKPFFNRTWRHFCSHRQTPPEGPADYPGAVRCAADGPGAGRCIWFAHPLFAIYRHQCPAWVKRMLSNAIDLLMPERVLTAPGAPSSLIASVMSQPHLDRDIVHLLSFQPERRGDFDIVEDVIPLHDVALELRLPHGPDSPRTAARLVPQDEPVAVEVRDGALHLTVPRVDGHQMIELR